MGAITTVPRPDSPVLRESALSRFTSEWTNFFTQFLAEPAAIEAVTVGASPFSWTAPTGGGVLVVEGGSVSDLDLTRGASTIDLGITAGPIPVATGDIIIITYAVLPTVSFLGA